MGNDILGTVKKPKVPMNPTDPKTIFIDPTNVMNYVGTRSKPSPISYSVLRAMAIRAKPVSAIINTRLNQIAQYTRRPSYDGDTGFKIALKDIDAKPTEADHKRAREIEEFFLKTGSIPNKKRKDNFNTFTRKLVRDSLILDAMTFEVVPNRKGEIVELWAVDGATIEMTTDMSLPNGETVVYQPITPKGRMIDGEISYVQRIFGQIHAEYTEDELAYAIRNPRTDIAFALYGLSELEVLIETITGILNAESYNSGYFSNNNLPQGILEIVGKYEDETLEGFKRQWETLISGSVGKWKVPVMALEEGQGLKFTPFKQSSRDMEFHQWLEFLTTVTCAVYQIDPSEIGFKAWSGGNNSGFRSDAEATRLQASKDKGFFPLMQFLSDTFNSEVMTHVDDRFVFEWVGLNEEDQKVKDEQRTARLNSGYSTVNEERKNEDKPSIKEMLLASGYDEEMATQLGMWGDLPGSQTLMQAVTTALQMKATQEQMEQGHQRDLEKTSMGRNFELEDREYNEGQQQDAYHRELEKTQLNRNFVKEDREYSEKQEEAGYHRDLEKTQLNRTFQKEDAQAMQNSRNSPDRENAGGKGTTALGGENKNAQKKKGDQNPTHKNNLRKSFEDDEDIIIEFDLED